LIRHGESTWNILHRFSGWADIPLTQTGCRQAVDAGRLLKESGFDFDIAYTSRLKRSIKTLDLVLEEMDLLWIPVIKAWQLNERQDGALQGMSSDEIKVLYGEENMIKWVSDFKVHPPLISAHDVERHPRHDKKYKDVVPALLSAGENFGETLERITDYWNSAIKKDVADRKNVLVCAHNHVLKCFTIMLGTNKPDDYLSISIPNSEPLVYEFDDDMNVTQNYYL